MKHPIPEEALDSDIAILGKKGGGKSYTAKGIVERLLDMGRRVLVLDPLGVWAGLRTGADGESDGYPVAIFGGLHADLPLDPAAAEPLARIIATENLPAVIDLADLSKTAQQAFLLKFLHELRRVNNDALTIVLEEADVFAPQNPQGDDSKQLHGEIDWIARRGRFKGFRLISITQRPARLSKDVLTQAATLVAHRLPSPQDREAVKAWVDGNGDRDKAKEVFDTLANLAVGEAWLYAPEQNILQRAKFPAIKTLDTSSTPKAGEKRIEPKTLAEVDVSAIREALASASAPSNETKKSNARATVDVAEAEDRGYRRGLKQGFSHGHAAATAEAKRRLLSFAAEFVVEEADPLPAPAPKAAAVAAPTRKPSPAEAITPKPPRAPATADKIGPAAEKLLAALTRYPDGLPSWLDVCIAAGMTHGNGYFYGGRKALVDLGLAIEGEGSVRATEAGFARSGGAGEPLTLNELIALWSPKLRGPGPQMLEHIAIVGMCTPSALADATGIKPGNGYWYGGIAAIRDVGLVTADKASIALANVLRMARGM